MVQTKIRKCFGCIIWRYVYAFGLKVSAITYMILLIVILNIYTCMLLIILIIKWSELLLFDHCYQCAFSTVTVKPSTIHGILQTIHKSLLDLELKKDKQQADLAVKFVAKATTSFILHIKVKKYLNLLQSNFVILTRWD